MTRQDSKTRPTGATSTHKTQSNTTRGTGTGTTDRQTDIGTNKQDKPKDSTDKNMIIVQWEVSGTWTRDELNERVGVRLGFGTGGRETTCTSVNDFLARLL
jgi:hypothetical protein